MVLFTGNKFRFSLQWNACSEEHIRAGQLLERLGNQKSRIIVPALIEYMENHPEISTPEGKISIVVHQAQSQEQMEALVKSMARAAVEELMSGMQLIPAGENPTDPPATTADLDDMLNNLEIFKA